MKNFDKDERKETYKFKTGTITISFFKEDVWISYIDSINSELISKEKDKILRDNL